MFPWLAKMIKEHRVKTLLILGDLTDAKDNHSAELVNQVVSSINSLPITDIRILTGNHDWLRKGHEFFKFLNMLPNVEFITRPTQDPDCDAYFLPYSKNPAADWAGLFPHITDNRYVFMHQTIAGARASNGQVMDGEGLPDLSRYEGTTFYSGDIHVPQRINGIIYVGSPYHVHFGDSFKPRCLLLPGLDQAHVDLHFKTISRVVLDLSTLHDLRQAKLHPGDQVKVRVRLTESEKHEWAATRRAITNHLLESGVEVHGVELNLVKSTRRHLVGEAPTRARLTPQESILQFVDREALTPSAYDAAMSVIES